MIRNKSLSTVVLALLLFAGMTHADAPRYYQLTLLHSNDTHGNLLPFNTPAETMPELSSYAKDGVITLGGIARRSTIFQQVKRRFGDTWLLDAGDYTDGTAFSIAFNGLVDVAAMNAVGYTAECFGNHEMKPKEIWNQLVAATKFPLVDANLVAKGTTQPVVKSYIIKQAGEVKVAIFGLLTTDARTYELAQDTVDILDPIETAKKLMPELRKQADVVVLLSHCGYDVDQQIAAQVDGIDVIVGGHSHTRLAQPTVVRKGDITSIGRTNGTYIVQAGQWGQELGCVEMKLRRNDDGWGLMSLNGKLIPVTEDVPTDKAIAKLVDKAWGKLRNYYMDNIGVATDSFVPRGNDEEPYYMVADLTRELLGTDVHLENMGGVRAYLCKGPVSRYDLARLIPWTNSLVTIDMTGQQLAKVITTGTPAASGARYRMKAGVLQELTVNGAALDEQKIYHVSTNSYFGGIICDQLKLQSKVVAKDARDSLAQAIVNKKSISPSYDGRRIIE
ncbi:MAG: bifunctional metallophosphatase/5'-nucleotidase [Armatimonadota bacterium]